MVAKLLVLCGILLASDAPQPAWKAKSLVARWEHAEARHASTGSEFTLTEYDHVFQTVSYREGSFYSRNGQESGDQQTAPVAFLTLSPVARSDQSTTVSRGEKNYRIEPLTDSSRWIMGSGKLVVVDDVAKTFEEIPKSQTILGFQIDFSFLSVRQFPFLPGCPGGLQADDWDFSIEKETETEYWIHGTPVSNRMAAPFCSCDLLFRKPHLSLRAVRTVDLAGTRERVFVIRTIRHDLPELPPPDLRSYMRQDHKPISNTTAPE